MLTEAVQEGSMHVRDPVGGSTEFLFVPLIKLFYTMLIMGVFQNGDLKNILRLIEPSVFSERQEEQEDTHKDQDILTEMETDGRGEDRGRNLPKEGLLQMKLPEPVKLQVTPSRQQISVIMYHYNVFNYTLIVIIHVYNECFCVYIDVSCFAVLVRLPGTSSN